MNIIYSNKLFFAGLLILVLVVLTVLLVIYVPRERSPDDSGTGAHLLDESQQALLTGNADDLNHALPQNLGDGIVFDSVGVGRGTMTYYHTLQNLDRQEIVDQNLADSLYIEAVERIPCSLWRPPYMANVEVSFIYYSRDREEILAFSKTEQECR